MDGSGIGESYAVETGRFDNPDGLIRLIHYGAALRAVAEHVDERLVTGPSGPMLDLLDHAFDRFMQARPTFRIEEFSLFVMSLMLNLCEDEAEAQRVRVGSARFILLSAPKLPRDYAPIIAGARRMLGAETPKTDRRTIPVHPDDTQRSVRRAAPSPYARAEASVRTETSLPETRLAATVGTVLLTLLFGAMSLVYLVYAGEDLEFREIPPAAERELR